MPCFFGKTSKGLKIRIVELFSDSLKSLYSLFLYFIMDKKEKTMSEITHEIDSNFAGRLNILRAGVLGANDGIISIAGVVIGVASATSNIWIIFLLFQETEEDMIFFRISRKNRKN